MTQQSGLSNMTRDDLEQYERAWADNMVKFWQEKMMAFSPPVYDTGMLHDSLSALMHPGPVTTITHHFLEYDLYVAAGTGNGYRRGNSGKDDDEGLQFMRGGKWKKGRGHRVSRDWFSRKYMYSIHRLNEKEAWFYGAAYQGMMSNALNALFGQGKTTTERTLGNL